MQEDKCLINSKSNFLFPVERYPIKVSYLEIEQAPGFIYIFLTIIKHYEGIKDNTEKIIDILKGLDLDNLLDDYIVESIDTLIQSKYITIKGNADFSKEQFKEYLVADFKLTDTGKQLLKEEYVAKSPTSKIVDIYYDYARKKLSAKNHYSFEEFKYDVELEKNKESDNEVFIKQNLSDCGFNERKERLTEEFEHRNGGKISNKEEINYKIKYNGKDLILIFFDTNYRNKDLYDFILKNYDGKLVSEFINKECNVEEDFKVYDKKKYSKLHKLYIGENDYLYDKSAIKVDYNNSPFFYNCGGLLGRLIKGKFKCILEGSYLDSDEAFLNLWAIEEVGKNELIKEMEKECNDFLENEEDTAEDNTYSDPSYLKNRIEKFVELNNSFFDDDEWKKGAFKIAFDYVAFLNYFILSSEDKIEQFRKLNDSLNQNKGWNEGVTNIIKYFLQDNKIKIKDRIDSFYLFNNELKQNKGWNEGVDSIAQYLCKELIEDNNADIIIKIDLLLKIKEVLPENNEIFNNNLECLNDLFEQILEYKIGIQERINKAQILQKIIGLEDKEFLQRVVVHLKSSRSSDLLFKDFEKMSYETDLILEVINIFKENCLKIKNEEDIQNGNKVGDIFKKLAEALKSIDSCRNSKFVIKTNFGNINVKLPYDKKSKYMEEIISNVRVGGYSNNITKINEDMISICFENFKILLHLNKNEVRLNFKDSFEQKVCGVIEKIDESIKGKISEPISINKIEETGVKAKTKEFKEKLKICDESFKKLENFKKHAEREYNEIYGDYKKVQEEIEEYINGISEENNDGNNKDTNKNIRFSEDENKIIYICKQLEDILKDILKDPNNKLIYLINQAKYKKYITKEEADKLHKLRKVRNATLHGGKSVDINIDELEVILYKLKK